MIRVKPERPEHIDGIRLVNEAAFGRVDEADLVDRLRADGHAILSFVALSDERVIGHILFSPVTLGSNTKALGLAPMAVLPEFQRRGIGSLLIAEGLQACRRAQHPRVVVLGHTDYYPRFGFVPASRYGVRCPYPVEADAFMALELSEKAFVGCSGTARYAPAFDTL